MRAADRRQAACQLGCVGRALRFATCCRAISATCSMGGNRCAPGSCLLSSPHLCNHPMCAEAAAAKAAAAAAAKRDSRGGAAGGSRGGAAAGSSGACFGGSGGGGGTAGYRYYKDTRLVEVTLQEEDLKPGFLCNR